VAHSTKSGRVPDSLVLAYTQGAPRTAHEALAVVLHVLMLESGFTSSSAYSAFAARDEPLVQMTYTTNTGSANAVVKCVAMSTLLIVNAAIEGDESYHIYQAQLPVQTYVKLHVPLSAGCSRVYQNMHALSRVLKDHVVHPLRARAHTLVGSTLTTTLDGLLPEIKVLVQNPSRLFTPVPFCSLSSAAGLTCVR